MKQYCFYKTRNSFLLAGMKNLLKKTFPLVGRNCFHCLEHLINENYGFSLGALKVFCKNWLLQRSNFSYNVFGSIIAAAESKRHHLPRQCLGNLLAKQSNKSLYLLQQTPCYFSAVTMGISYI